MKQHISCLDGIRGGLALWVFWGHLANAVGLNMPLLSAPALAVDLFMLLSGFLMSWHWESKLLAQDRTPYRQKLTDFWTRRFFRIAPLYYPLFIAVTCLNPQFTAARDRMLSAYPPEWLGHATGAIAGPTSAFSPLNMLTHLSFVFGLLPSYAANNALPDWSISLEMQFYLVFPLLAAFCKPKRILLFSAASVGVGLVSARLLGVGPAGSGLLAHYPQPSVLLLKIHIFAAGMALGWLAASTRERPSRAVYWVAFLLPLLFVPKPVGLASLLIGALILVPSGPTRFVARILGSKPFRVGGELSYDVYLLHYLPSYLVLDVAYRGGYLSGLSSGTRFLFAAALLTPPVYLVAYMLHRLIEKPGIEVGRRLSGRVQAHAATAALPRARNGPAAETAAGG
jgi:peptidoglycan/LPS O-acetylase OafA/YrhL